jgi:hypothetical protein
VNVNGKRLWRVRKLHRAIDAHLRNDSGPELQLVYGDRVIYRRLWPTIEEAEDDASAKLADLQRAGWTEHW